MKLLFDQYQRYKNAQLIIDGLRRHGEKFRILEVGANEHKNLEKFLTKDTIYYLDIKLSEEKLNDEQYILGDATEMTFEDNSFDFIVALDVYEHIIPERRSRFLKELVRVARVGFVIGAPFNDTEGEVHRTEERMNEAYRVLYGHSHPWLEEHIVNGLPDLLEAERLLEKLHISYEMFGHGGLDVWERMMYMQIMADYDPQLLSYFDTVSEYYNETVFCLDYVENSYRKFIVGNKQNRELKLQRNTGSDKKLGYLNQVYLSLFESVKLKRNLNQKKSIPENTFLHLFFDEGEGFNERGSLSEEIREEKIIYHYDFPEVKKVRKIRLDPVNKCAVVKIQSLSLVDESDEQKEFIRGELQGATEGLINLGENFYISIGEDPQIYIQNKEFIKSVYLDMDIFVIDQKVAAYLQKIWGNIEVLQDKLKFSNKEYTDAKSEYMKIKDEYFGLKEAYPQLESEKAIVEQRAEQYEAMYEAVTNSACWKVTAPIRTIGDVFAKRYIQRAIQCVRDNGLAYTVNLYRTGGYDKGNDVSVRHSHSEKEFKGKIIDYFELDSKEAERQKTYQFNKNIKFSVLVPLYNTPERFLCEMIDSVQYQTYQNWELCLADGSDKEQEKIEQICKEYASHDPRIIYKKLDKNGGISENTNACIDMATGEYISLFDHDDILHPCALFETMMMIEKQGADYIYTDEATFEGTNISHIITRHCKPDFAIDNLRANNYICHFSSFKRTLLDKAGRFRKEYDGSQDHDLILRLTEAAECVCHIPKILYYWRSHANSVAQDINAKEYAIDAARRAVLSHLERVGLEGEVISSKAFPTIFQIKYKIKGMPRISIIIPNKDHVAELSTCLRSIMMKSTYANYEIIIVENNSQEAETEEYYKMIREMRKIKIVRYKGGFNYSQIINFGRKYASGDYLLLLNNDTEVISKDWMEQLLMFAQREDVGAVGAKLYFPDNTIQHAGVVVGLGADRTAGHIHYGVSRDNLGYMGKLFYAQDVTAVTAACLMVSARKYDEVNGFDESLAVALNDVDFCLKIREKGYLNIFNPYAELYHYESKSRGKDISGERKMRYDKEAARFKEKWKEVLEAGDPFYNRNFSLDRADYFYVGDKK